MKVLVCHPGTQHAGRLALVLRQQGILGRFVTGLRLESDSAFGRLLRVSALRSLDPSLEKCTRQIRLPELLAKAAQCIGWKGERLMRWRNALFQKLIPEHEFAACDAVIGFDTSSWILARRAKKLGKPFVLERTAVNRSTRASIGAHFHLKAEVARSDAEDVQQKLETEEAELAAKVVVASEFSARAEQERNDGGKVVVIPYGVDWDWFSAADRKPVDTKPLVFLFVGLLKEEKGIAILLEAWKNFARADAELWLAGTGEADMLRTAAEIPGVKVMGKLAPQKLRETYHSASVFVFPTYYDGFGMVLLEAMASGLPIMATPNCAAPELLRVGTAGCIFPAGDAPAVSKLMEGFRAHRAAWLHRGVAARQVAKSYTWEAYGTAWARLLWDLVR